MKKYFLPFLVFILAQPTYASVQLSVNRLICQASNPDCTMTLKNDDNRSYLIQSWLDVTGNPALTGKRIPFVVTPPLFRMPPKSENVVQLVYNDSGLPKNKESLLWLNIKSIPALNDGESLTKNKMLIAVSNRIKVFYRPQGLNGSAAAALKDLKWERGERNQVRAVNSSSYYVVLNHISLNGNEVKISIETNNTVVAPGGEQTFLLEEGGAASVAIKWSGINDFSAQSEVFSKQL